MNKLFPVVVLITVICIGLVGCDTAKKIPYFQNLPDSTDTTVSQSAFAEPKIQSDDILSIIIQTVDPGASASVNQEGIKGIAAGGQQISGFLVDKNGEVELPIIGAVKLMGLTTYEARKVIKEKASKHFVNPNVQVRFANFKVTVIGEVNHPATYTVPNEKVSILDIIGMAGDLTIYGKRDNVLLIRETDKGKKMVRFNLNNSQLFDSPYYYLKQNDIVYVEPAKSKIASTDSAKTRLLAIITSVASLVTIIVVRFF
ncbi:MAG TPA: polysaccharide biosynthesis/export family protein [Pseudosphingobacterium sp.]|nr:polysaccharide biosynthesis/export family protein [Pseudosphingobacterium sp.]